MKREARPLRHQRPLVIWWPVDDDPAADGARTSFHRARLTTIQVQQ